MSAKLLGALCYEAWKPCLDTPSSPMTTTLIGKVHDIGIGLAQTITCLGQRAGAGRLPVVQPCCGTPRRRAPMPSSPCEPISTNPANPSRYQVYKAIAKCIGGLKPPVAHSRDKPMLKAKRITRSEPAPRERLRRRAEALLKKSPHPGSRTPAADAQKVVHELGVHQVELEMQNEELRRTELELMRSRDRFSDLYDFAPVGYLTINLRGNRAGGQSYRSKDARCGPQSTGGPAFFPVHRA